MRLRLFWATSAAAIALIGATPALADCATTTGVDGTVTLTCGNTVTAPTLNRSGNTPSTLANYQAIDAPLNVNVNAGVTISGWGMTVDNGRQPASPTSRPLNVVNDGTISHTVGSNEYIESYGLTVSTNSGPIRYSGNGSITTNGIADASGDVLGPSTALIITASGLGNSVAFGTQAAPVSASFSGEAGILMVAENSRLDAWFAGGSITATRRDNGAEALSIIAADTIGLRMTGGTVVNGGIVVSQTAGPGHNASSGLSVTTDARVVDGSTAGAGLSVFSREAGADVSLTSGAAFNVANIGVSLTPATGAVRFATAAGTTINQTGGSGAVRTGVWFTPIGAGSLVADLSGSIAATGTGLLLQPANWNAVVTVRGGGSISGGQAAIQIEQNSGATGTLNIANAGTLSGPLVLTGATAGTALSLTNSGTMTGRVNITGSSASSLISNSGTWNLGTGDSAFSGSLTSSGTLNLANGAANTLTINGNLVLTSGSVFRVDVGATQGATDRVIVTGAASLAGSVAAIGGGAFTAGTYTLLTANGGRTGTFSPLTTSPSATAALRYDANNVFLDISAAAANQTFSFSIRDGLVFNAATVTTNRTTAYSTQILGRLVGGAPLFDQTFAAPFADPTVQNGVTAARAAITLAGGPGVIIGDPVRTSSTTTSTTVAGVTTYSLAGPGAVTTSVVSTFGPDTIQTGALSTCSVTSLPSTTRPTCSVGGTSVVVGDAIENFNTITATTYTINETRTDTITETLRETYEINGQVVAVGSVHAEVQSGLFDLGARLLGRLGRVEAGTAGWAEAYGFRVEQGGRRSAQGAAGGVGIAAGPGLTVALGVDRGQIDLDLPGARETGRVELTEFGGAVRYNSGPIGASFALVRGFGNADTRRTIIGSSRARYDVSVTGAALDMGYAMDLGGWTLRPEAGVDWVRLSTDGFAETDTLGLVASGASAQQMRATAGVSVERALGRVTLSARARYLTVLDGADREIPVAFALAPGAPLNMSAPGEPDGALLAAAALIRLAPAAQLSVVYDARLGGGYTSHAGRVGVRIAF